MRISLLFLTLLSIGVTSCDNQKLVDDFYIVEKDYPNATVDFWPYLQSFERESAERGKEIDLSNSGIVLGYKRLDNLVQGPNPSPSGTCYHNIEEPNAITIDSATFIKGDRFAQEKIIFHELGHCSLGRGHDDSSFLNSGICKSLMRSNPFTSNCTLQYNEDTKQAYLDELFSK